MTEPTSLRVGIIGVGWGAHVQVPGFRAAQGFEPVALCARTPERLERVAGRLGIDETSTDWQSFVTRDDLDVISVATPTVLHRDMTLAALDAGKAVLCEKPLAGDLDAARDMVRAADKSSRPTACCFENRWNPDWLAVADKLRSGFLGSPYLARVSRSASYWHPSRQPQARWMYDRDQGGGYLAGMLVHDLDFLCSVLGRPESVCAEVRTSDPVRELPDGETLHITADDTAALLMRMESGVTAILSISVMGAHADHYRLELFGSDGTITGDGALRSAEYLAGAAADDGMSPLPVNEREPAHPEYLPKGLAGHASRAMALMLEDWLPAFEGAPSTAATFDDGLLSLAVIDAARRSAEGGGWEAVHPTV
ncbi:Gfo/Idh/MocA family protein [Mycolicibacterium monacense]|uniref:Oxidoreductase n=1 Tax=Mycolicibacterium monacense TaxID=85693 RepID=A0AAD1MY88_MYCMB|nr:Gfo/Idh/MocA family oxidoreductase [Mycolicibacterium monacense]MDA4104671.1 oxidoreductase [Mycolicibacterium monacense DSM 44395]ORB22708.1 oxidoreductase [Mycolicibacterium monacense DSM 44395]QHP87591.1 Gfo/Idh/MocA family oxidoreductase [Mycolicibacterium monacense DSM 44395]BBZ59260.1 oxidoreductase [Mycolicibacterium monacense]